MQTFSVNENRASSFSKDLHNFPNISVIIGTGLSKLLWLHLATENQQWLKLNRHLDRSSFQSNLKHFQICKDGFNLNIRIHTHTKKQQWEFFSYFPLACPFPLIVLDSNSQLPAFVASCLPFFFLMQQTISNWSNIPDTSFDWRLRTIYRPCYP